MDAVKTHRLRKSYGNCEILHGIDITVPAGSLYGFLGPNGAGKTTTLRVLLGLLRASGGSAVVLGKDPWHDGPKVRQQIGYLPGELTLYPHMTGRELLSFLDSARRCDSRKEIARLAELLQLNLDQRIRQFSRGMKQKLGLIQALMHRPDLLILDEPTVGLDPLMRELLLRELRRVAEEGRTVLFSSHTLSEVDQLCDWVGILRQGKLIEQQPMESLRAKAVRRVEIVLRDGAEFSGNPPKSLRITKRGDHRWTANWVGPMDGLIGWLATQAIEDVTIARPDLEDLFLAYYDESRGEQGT